MSQQRGLNPLSSWLAPLIPGSWIQGKALHIRKTEAVSLVGYGTVMSMFCNTASEASTLKQLLLLWGCAEAAFYVYQKWRYIASTQAYDHPLHCTSELSHPLVADFLLYISWTCNPCICAAGNCQSCLAAAVRAFAHIPVLVSGLFTPPASEAGLPATELSTSF